MTLYQLERYQDTAAEGFTKRMVRESPQALVFVLNFQPGQALPAHSHAESEVVLTVLTGEGEVTVDGRVERVRAGAVVHCEGRETLSATNTGKETLSLLVFLYPGNPRFAGNVR